MPANQAIQSLVQSLTGDPGVTVLVAAEPEETIVIQRLSLRQDLAAEFLSAAKDSVPSGNQEVRLRPYEAGYKPDPDEITYVDLVQNQVIADQIREFSQVQQAALFHEDDEIIDSLRFYAIVVSPTARRRAVFFRTYSPKKELSRKAGFAALFSRGSYNKVDSKIFLFDHDTDCFAWDGYLFIHNVGAFQRIFGYFDELRARAHVTIDTVLAQIPVSNADAFRTMCTGQLQMLSKLAQIARKPYLPRVTMVDIRRTIDEFHIDVQIVRENGQEKLLFEGNLTKRWLILKLLDDDYLGSTMTHEKYEVNSKSALG
ncbi:MAG TPA: Kiwa anti-phage protein KwaB-like domain-containing protein [Pyrinomonadaceae bacterium]|nr:Kiwa anti-phage protein KwaB-like domain-containing protein [Pyrinomonadaceae bacterium]HLE63262.1 Kiwa anti-phage protein KwaB-like domain-containing protein [Pyrinomonadaceae bacterium]